MKFQQHLEWCIAPSLENCEQHKAKSDYSGETVICIKIGSMWMDLSLRSCQLYPKYDQSAKKYYRGCTGCVTTEIERVRQSGEHSKDVLANHAP